MTLPSTTRRTILRAGVAGSVGFLGLGQNTYGSKSDSPPVRVITKGPKYHWFGYYDKLQFDPTDRYVLGMEVDFEHRQPTPEDEIAVGMVDLQDGDRWIELGRTKAWCWQQGCMLQWLPGSESEVVWNDREDGQFVCRILNVQTQKMRTIPNPIYALAPDGKTAVSLDFNRVNHTRPGYGYGGIPDPYREDSAPENLGVYRVDMATGEKQMLFSLAEIAQWGAPLASMNQAKHLFNHLLVNTDGTRFEFMHRWRGRLGGRSIRETRMFTATLDGKDLRLIDDNGYTSHFIWRDANHILAWSNQPSHGRCFYLFEDGGERKIEAIGPSQMTKDGHVSYLPNQNWILCDTYPYGSERMQNPYLYHIPTDRRISLGLFPSPQIYRGAWRCDTHPRFSRNGQMVVVDSPDAGNGRQLHLIDISNIVG